MQHIIKDPSNWQARMARHIAADKVIQGVYWLDGRGCFIGCSVHGDDPQPLVDEIGLPLAVIRIAEAIFERLPKSDAIEFTKRISAPGVIREGADVSLVQWQFLLWLNTTPEVNPGITGQRVKPAIDRVVNDVLLPLSRGEDVSKDVSRSAAESAWSATWSARCAAESAAESAAWSAELSAASAARAARAAWDASGSFASCRLTADKLIELLSEAA